MLLIKPRTGPRDGSGSQWMNGRRSSGIWESAKLDKEGSVVTDTVGDKQPRVLLLYYTYTGQSLKVLEAAGEVFRERGCEVDKAEIEFTDRRFAERFSRFPMRRVWPDMLSVLPAQVRRA